MRYKSHIIEGTGLEGMKEMWLGHETLMAQSPLENKSMKSIKVTLQGLILTRRGDDIMYHGTSLDKAIDAYNEIY